MREIKMNRLAIISAALACTISEANSQTSPNWSYGYVPTAAEIRNAFASKQDRLTFSPLNQSGGTMSGRLNTAASTVNSAGFSILPGIAPVTPNNGDVWLTTSGMFARINGNTVPVAGATGFAPITSPAFAGSPTAPSPGSADNSTRLATTAFANLLVGTETTRAQAAEALLAPLASPTFTGTATISALTGTTATPLTHFYSGQNAKTALVFDATAVSTSAAEQTGMFRMNSTTGAAGGVAAYKMALGAESTCGSGSSDCWGMTTVLTTTNGYPVARNQIAHEFDQNNNSGTNCADVDLGVAGTVGCGTVLITGAGSNQINFGLGIGGYSKVRNGIAFFSGGPIAASIRDYSSSISVLYDTGAHSNGIALSGTYSANAISSPGFTVGGTGALSAASITTGGQVTALYQKLTPVTYATVQGQRPCNSTNQGNMAFVTDSNTATFNAAVAGGGTNAMAVVCNGTAYVVH
jgi:hypothetical protein